MCVCVCMYVYMHIYIYIYTQLTSINILNSKKASENIDEYFRLSLGRWSDHIRYMDHNFIQDQFSSFLA